jgi:hypothetical protein
MIVAQPQEHRATSDLCQRLQAEARQSGTGGGAGDKAALLYLNLGRLTRISRNSFGPFEKPPLAALPLFVGC